MSDINLPVFSFLPNWARGVTETLEWVTDVLRSDISGHEQRRSVRLSPRRFFEATFNPTDEARSFMDLWLQRFGAQEFLLPLWHDRAKLNQAAPQGTRRLSFANTFREFETDGYALLRTGLFGYTVVLIEDQDDDGLDLAGNLNASWGVGTVIYPLRPAALDNLQAVLASITRNVARVPLSFRVTRENDYPLGAEPLPMYDGFPLVTLEPNRRDDLQTRFEQMYAESDYDIGRVYRRTEADRAFAAQFYNWQARGRQQHHELRQTLYRLAGRQKAVWMPSFNKDVVLARNLSAVSNRLDIREIGYRYLGGPIAGRDRIMLKDDTGERKILTITGTSEPLEEGEDRLNLSASAGFTASAGREGSFVDLVRMDQDRVEITHHTDSDGVCEVAAAFRSFAQGRTTAGTLVQPTPIGLQDFRACGEPAPDEVSNCLFFFTGWYARAVVTLTGSSKPMPSGFVRTEFEEVAFKSGADTYLQGRPRAIWSNGFRTVTLYFYNENVAETREVQLQTQWNGRTSLAEIAAMRVRFNFNAWDEDFDSFGGSTPKPESTILSPGRLSISTNNPMSVRRVFPSRWFF